MDPHYRAPAPVSPQLPLDMPILIKLTLETLRVLQHYKAGKSDYSHSTSSVLTFSADF